MHNGAKHNGRDEHFDQADKSITKRFKLDAKGRMEVAQQNTENNCRENLDIKYPVQFPSAASDGWRRVDHPFHTVTKATEKVNYPEAARSDARLTTIWFPPSSRLPCDRCPSNSQSLEFPQLQVFL